MKLLKRTLLVLLIAFVIYAIFTSPAKSGDVLHSAADITTHAFKSIGSFFDSILNGK